MPDPRQNKTEKAKQKEDDVDETLPVYFSILFSSVKEKTQEKETWLSLNSLSNAEWI